MNYTNKFKTRFGSLTAFYLTQLRSLVSNTVSFLKKHWAE